jgi:hypothetical protein
MKKADLLAEFGGDVRKLAAFLGVSPQAIYLWRDNVPKIRVFQLRLEHPKLAKKLERR